MPSIFTKIIEGSIPAHIVHQNEDFIAFLDIMPLAKGHTLIVPKKEVDYIFDMESAEYSKLWSYAQEVAKAMKSVIPCKKIGIAVIGLEVPHAHIHLVPMNEVSDLNFERKRVQAEATELSQIAELIKNAI
jgi:histidine triad (HIT) family protein